MRRVFEIALCALVAAPFGSGAEDPSGILTRVQDIRVLSRSEAAKKHPVRIRGVVIWQDSGRQPSLFVHDGSASIWVDRATSVRRNAWQGGNPPVEESRVGSLVDVEGFTDPGGYAPCVVPTHIRHIGNGTVPEPLSVPLEDLLSGRQDGQFVFVEGVIQEVSKPDELGDAKITLMVDGHPCRIASERGSSLDPSRLVDARVRVRGILVPLPNLRSEVAGLRINIMGPENIEILVPPPADPFLAARVPLHGLLPFSPEARPFHRKVTSGVVTLAMPGRFFFLQDGSRSVRVQSDADDVVAGDRVDVAGFIDTSQVLAAVTGAIVRKLGRAEIPPPEDVPVDRIIHPDFRNAFEKVAESDYSGRLVRFEAQMLHVERNRTGGKNSIIVAADGQVLPAILADPNAQVPPEWVEGALLELTGVAELDFKEEPTTQASMSISGIRLWLRSADDVRVIDTPSWWTPRRLAMALAAVLAILTLALAWNLALGRLLQKRTRMLEVVMRRHRDSEIEYAAAQQERRRLAGDLHDGLQQLIAGAAYRMEAAAARLGDVPPSVDEQLNAARRALVRSQEGLREVLWGLRHMEDDGDDFAALLRHACTTVDHWPQGAVEIITQGEVFPVARQVGGSLLMLMQEAVGNAFKHGKAGHVTVTVIYSKETMAMQIRDNGGGFDSASVPGPKDGHFGLESARLRMKWLQGTFGIHSTHGEGTLVTCTIPASVARTRETATINPIQDP